MVCHPQQMQVVTCWHLQSMTSTLYVLSSGKQRWQIYIFLVSGAVLSSFGASARPKHCKASVTRAQHLIPSPGAEIWEPHLSLLLAWQCAGPFP